MPGTLLFRAMKPAPDGLPVVEESARGLGARVPIDITSDLDGFVSPLTGGMSVTPDDPRRMNALRRPRSLGGAGKDPLFVIDESLLGAPLAFRRDPRDSLAHGFVEPVERCPLGVYQAAIVGTRLAWRAA